MANNVNNPCKVITSKCRLSYAHIWEPSSMDEKSPKKYSACIIWPKSDTAMTKKVEAAMEAATQDGIKAKWKGKKPAKLKLPMRDGDEERPEDEAFQGCWFLNANSSKQPGVVDLARMTASTANSQALKFKVVNSPEENALVFPTLGWACALPQWDGPEEGERPGAYIIIVEDSTLGKNKLTDVGITAQTILLGAVEKGYGGCMLANVKRDALAEALGIDAERYVIRLVLALGKPKEEVKVVPVGDSGDVKYYRDENQVHYVPKRGLEEILL